MEKIQTAPEPLRLPMIFKYWLPLALSWVLMAFEPPFVNGAIARLPEAERMIAAFGVVFAISLVIESPVISLLPTSTALAHTRQNYAMLKRFTTHLVLIVTALHLLIAWTPLFDLVVIRWMKAPPDLIDPIRLGLKLMVPWSGAIAWRKFKQGVLIRYGQAKFVGQGTLVRLSASAGTAVLLAVFTDLPGIAVGTSALSCGVLAEALFSHLVARKTIAIKFFGENTRSGEDLGYGGLVRFHLPLALSNLIYLAAGPLIASALARGANPIDDLAAWPVVNGMLFVMRAPAVALPEAVIALYRGADEAKPLARFSWGVGAALTLLLVLVSLTPMAGFYFDTLIGLTSNLTAIATPAAQAGFLLPMVTALLFHYRGILTAEKRTVPITVGMAVELVILGAVLFGGISLGISGVTAAAAALTAGIAVDALLLIVYFRLFREGRKHEVYNPGLS